MGQGSSSDSGLQGDLAFLGKKLSAQAQVLNRLAFLRHRELVTAVEELNSTMKDFIDRHGKQLCFTIRKGTDGTLLWKTTIRIRCIKLNTQNNTIESSRLLNLRQFIIMYQEIKDQILMLSVSEDKLPPEQERHNVAREEQEQFTASSFFSTEDLCEGDSECCVCMDRKACIMLSCSHEFCETCIDSWTKDKEHSTCPLCRSRVKGADDAWVLPDKNEAGSYENEVKGYLVSLADREDD